MLAGLIYDLSGGYRLFLVAGAVGCALGGLIIVTMPAFPVWKKSLLAGAAPAG
jgi:hypothetical protein